MIRTWKISETNAQELHFEGVTSLDAITRQLPDGYYSTFRTYNECKDVVGLADHLRRLYEPVPSAQVGESGLRRQLRSLLEAYRPGEARVRTVITHAGQLYIAIEPLQSLPPEVYEAGVRLETTDMRRETPRLKTTAFIAASLEERKHILERGIFEALLTRDGQILEGMTSNFFFAGESPEGPYIGTAGEEILLGVTRKTVIEVAHKRGFEIRYQPLKRDELAEIAEAFITSSSRGVVPVVQIDAVVIGQGKPGPITRDLSAAYQEHVLQTVETI